MSAQGDIATPSDDEMRNMSNEELTRLGAALDEVEMAESSKRFVPGSPGDRRAERSVTRWFLFAALLGLAFILVFLLWPAGYQDASTGGAQVRYALFTPLLGVTLGGCVLCFGVGVVNLAKKITPHEVAIQHRHEGMSKDVDRRTLAAEVVDTVDKMGLVKRRGLLKSGLVLAGGGLGLAVVVEALGGFIRNPWAKGPKSDMWVTLWAPTPDGTKIRLVQQDGSPVRPSDMDAGGLMTVYPGVPGGEVSADSPVLLFRLRPNSTIRIRNGQDGFEYGEYYAYSKVCTHVGCPASLFEQQTGRILCPCHQSQFDVFDGAKPIFGPASRPLPQLPIELDAQGYFVARGDFIEPIGPGFWESDQARFNRGSHLKGSST